MGRSEPVPNAQLKPAALATGTMSRALATTQEVKAPHGFGEAHMIPSEPASFDAAQFLANPDTRRDFERLERMAE